ncbi:hypothetical protein BBB02_04520 [Wolbachia endosymbiont of Bemisia tabaci]|nr:hypothetical protein BBB02_04520 [Wolbachia endosymbiont of Bemisia tabaci]
MHNWNAKVDVMKPIKFTEYNGFQTGMTLFWCTTFGVLRNDSHSRQCHPSVKHWDDNKELPE